MARTLRGRFALIGNPRAGRGRGAVAMREAASALALRAIEPVLLPTEHAGHAVDLAGAAAAAKLLLVVGGDGTVRDVVQGLGRGSAPLALLPGGTGNDLARCLGIPRDIERAVEIALTGRERGLDVWMWNRSAFVNVAGGGRDAARAAVVNRRFRRLHGMLAYLCAFFLTLPGFRPLELRLAWPQGGWAGRLWLAAFANGVCYGGGMRIAPDAVPDDGLLDLVVVEDVPKLELLRQLPGIFRGAHVRHPRVKSFRVETVRIDGAVLDATIDGELIDATPAVLARRPHGVRLRVPRAGSGAPART